MLQYASQGREVLARHNDNTEGVLSPCRKKTHTKDTKMVIVNGRTVPTCAELAEMLKLFGDKPLFTGEGWFAAIGFCPVPGGIQISAQRCQPEGGDARTRG